MVVGLYMFWFALQVGFIIPGAVQDPSALGAMAYVQDRDISLPNSTYTNHEYQQSRLYIYIVIDKYGITEVLGEPLLENNRIKFLRSLRYEQPKGIPIFVVDKDTPMEFVTQIIHYVQEAGFRRIKFSTSQETINQAGT